jgi:hypothetical protein
MWEIVQPLAYESKQLQNFFGLLFFALRALGFSFRGLWGVFIAPLSAASKRCCASFSEKLSEEVTLEELRPPELTDISRVSFQIPSSVQKKIARAIMAFSLFESTVEMAIWDILKLDADDGRIFTRTMVASRKIGTLKEVIQRRSGGPISGVMNEDFWKLAGETATDRNTIAHGTWIWLDGSTPAVVSLRWMDQPNSISAITYPTGRLELVERSSKALDIILRGALVEMQVRRPPFEPQHHAGTNTPPTNHQSS